MRWAVVAALLLGGAASAVPFVSAREATNIILRSEQFDNASWSKSGTGSVTADSWDFGVGAPTGETVTDSDGAARYALSQTLGTAVTGPYVFSCHLQAGTLSTVTLRVTVAGGTGTIDCAVTGLGASPVRRECATTAGAGTTSITPLVLIGTAGADQGTVKVGGCQLERGAVAGPYCPTVTASARCVLAAIGGVLGAPSTEG